MYMFMYSVVGLGMLVSERSGLQHTQSRPESKYTGFRQVITAVGVVGAL